MKVALVTGAGKGLGEGFVNALVQKGYFVFAGVRHVDDYIDTENTKYIKLDITDDTQIADATKIVTDLKGRLDLLVNNAGLNKDTATNGHKELAVKLDSLDRQVLQGMFDVNATGPLMLAKAFVPIMQNENSYIINISSNRASFQDKNNNGNYGYRASKVALNMFTQALTFDLPVNVGVFAVHPGSVKTDMNPNGQTSPKESALKILAIIDNWSEALNGKFLDNNGNPYPA